MKSGFVTAGVACGLLAGAGLAGAQILPSEPIQVAGGRLVIAGEVSASLAPSDRAFFNYTDYEYNTLRLVRFGATAALELHDRVAVLGELRLENWDTLRPFALFVRVRPWTDRAFDLQAGRIPPVFGAFARRAYGTGNPLIGYPLAYQYLTTVRPDAFPATADDLLRMRGRGWLTQFPLGARDPAAGLPLVAALGWDVGVQVRVGSEPVQLAAAVTSGSLSNPRLDDGNGGKQVAARVGIQPVTGLVAGVSAARGEYARRSVVEGLAADSTRSLRQHAIGLDAEYSRGHWLVRAEAIFSAWDMPAVRAPLVRDPLRAASVSVEGRYTIRPGLYAAARADHLAFSRITGTLFDARPTPWDAPVSRIEIGGGYALRRNVVAKVSVQRNWREGGPRGRRALAAAQILYWF